MASHARRLKRVEGRGLTISDEQIQRQFGTKPDKRFVEGRTKTLQIRQKMTESHKKTLEGACQYQLEVGRFGG